MGIIKATGTVNPVAAVRWGSRFTITTAVQRVHCMMLFHIPSPAGPRILPAAFIAFAEFTQ